MGSQTVKINLHTCYLLPRSVMPFCSVSPLCSWDRCLWCSHCSLLGAKCTGPTCQAQAVMHLPTHCQEVIKIKTPFWMEHSINLTNLPVWSGCSGFCGLRRRSSFLFSGHSGFDPFRSGEMAKERPFCFVWEKHGKLRVQRWTRLKYCQACWAAWIFIIDNHNHRCSSSVPSFTRPWHWFFFFCCCIALAYTSSCLPWQRYLNK